MFFSQETSDDALSCSDILHYPNIAIATAQMFLLTDVKFYKQNKYQKQSMV